MQISLDVAISGKRCIKVTQKLFETSLIRETVQLSLDPFMRGKTHKTLDNAVLFYQMKREALVKRLQIRLS